MIYSLKGKVLQVNEEFVVLDVGGVGYKVFAGSLALEIKNSQELFLYTYQAVRENALDLFGFKTESELQLFELLISISGIGPRVAMAILAVTTPQSLKRAVVSQNLEELTKVSGIGKKNAQKILIELATKINKIEVALPEYNSEDDLEVYETLEALGFSRPQIQESLRNISGDTTAQKVKNALKLLGNK